LAAEAGVSMERLLLGIRKFRDEFYPERQSAYEQLVREGQKPHALFITCADSRIDPEALTQSEPGEIFVSRNIGNLVPAYGEMLGATSAVIEYAVEALNVGQIVICGHSDCGAMKGLLNPEKVESMPTVKSWLRNAEAALSVVRARKTPEHEQDLVNRLIEQNVLLQLNHLRTHPSVAGRLAEGTLEVSGWIYDIAHGAVLIYDEATRKFVDFEAKLNSLTRAEGKNG
jgi:carbonic anhydrase